VPTAQPGDGVEVVEVVAEAHHGQAVSDEEPGSDRPGGTRQRTPVNDTGQRINAENVEASS
jgi:hypothetical protein